MTPAAWASSRAGPSRPSRASSCRISRRLGDSRAVRAATARSCPARAASLASLVVIGERACQRPDPRSSIAPRSARSWIHSTNASGEPSLASITACTNASSSNSSATASVPSGPRRSSVSPPSSRRPVTNALTAACSVTSSGRWATTRWIPGTCWAMRWSRSRLEASAHCASSTRISTPPVTAAEASRTAPCNVSARRLSGSIGRTLTGRSSASSGRISANAVAARSGTAFAACTSSDSSSRSRLRPSPQVSSRSGRKALVATAGSGERAAASASSLDLPDTDGPTTTANGGPAPLSPASMRSSSRCRPTKRISPGGRRPGRGRAATAAGDRPTLAGPGRCCPRRMRRSSSSAGGEGSRPSSAASRSRKAARAASAAAWSPEAASASTNSSREASRSGSRVTACSATATASPGWPVARAAATVPSRASRCMRASVLR